MKPWKFILGFILAVVVLSCATCGYALHHFNKITAEMDKRELNYDADGWFIMVDKDNDLVGVYYATKPIFYQYGVSDEFESKGVLDAKILVYDKEGIGCYDPGDETTWWME